MLSSAPASAGSGILVPVRSAPQAHAARTIASAARLGSLSGAAARPPRDRPASQTPVGVQGAGGGKGGGGSIGSGSGSGAGAGKTPGTGSTRTPGSQTSGVPTAPAGPDPLFGAWTDGAPYDGNVDAIDALQGKLNRRVDIVNWYQNLGSEWASQVQPGVIGAVVDSGRMPLLTWEPWDPAKGVDQPNFSLARIAGGALDAQLQAWADGLRDAGTTIYFRPMHEMNGNWYPWAGTVNGNTPADYVAAWKHMHDVFAAAGATNVKWVWSPVPWSSPHTAANAIERYYPGAEYVDVMALDGYNWGSTRPEYGGWQSFGQIFKAAYDTLAGLGPQPIWIAEVGCAPEGGDKAAWVRDMFATARTWSRLNAIVWFDQDKEEDWRAAPVASAFASVARR